jgi:hypothetical protein
MPNLIANRRLLAPRNAGIQPSSFPGLLRNYRADTYSQTDGTTLASNWTDLTGNSDAAPTASQEPTFQTNIFGTRPAVRFTTGKNLTFTLILVSAGTAPFTVAFVSKSLGDFVFLTKTGINNQLRVGRSGANVLSFFADATNEVISADAGGITLASARLNVIKRTGSVFSFRVNKTLLTPDTTNAGGFTGINQIGAGTTPAFSGVGDMGQLCVWDNEISNDNMDLLYDGFFKPVWGLP